MSHTLASRCTVCGVLDDTTCPECRMSSAQAHGIADQRPFTSDLVYEDGTRHEWHPACLTAPIPPGQDPTTDHGVYFCDCRTDAHERPHTRVIPPGEEKR